MEFFNEWTPNVEEPSVNEARVKLLLNHAAEQQLDSDMKEKFFQSLMLQLEEENEKLKKENEQLRLKLSYCRNLEELHRDNLITYRDGPHGIKTY